MADPTPDALGAQLTQYLRGLDARVGALESAATPAPATGAPWPSGVCRTLGPTQYTQGSLDAWNDWRGRRGDDLALTYSPRDGDWPDLVNPGYMLGNWTKPGTTIVVGQPFTPNRYGQATTVNAGQTDGQWQSWGRAVAAKRAAGFPVLTSLAWEANGDWYPWSAKDPKAYVSAFQRVVRNIRIGDPGAEIVWTVNAGGSQNPPSHDPRDLWPGDEFVDVIGLDLYDHWPRAVGDDAVAAREKTAGRAEYWATFAQQHGKPLLLLEWGLSTVSPQGGGDNPAFIRWAHTFLTRLWNTRLPDGRRALRGESYFDDYSTSNVASGLREWNRNANSAAEYLRLWR